MVGVSATPSGMRILVNQGHQDDFAYETGIVVDDATPACRVALLTTALSLPLSRRSSESTKQSQPEP